jgi:two-component system LytT family response regulator
MANLKANGPFCCNPRADQHLPDALLAPMRDERDAHNSSMTVERCVAVKRKRRLNSTVSGAGESQWLSRLSIKDEEHVIFVPVDEVIWIEAADKYVVIHTATGTHISRHTIQGLEDKLDPKEFVRTHRSTLVRKAAVRGLHPLFHGDYIVKLASGAEVTLSRSFRESFFREMSR